jgi:hypothetical protein
MTIRRIARDAVLKAVTSEHVAILNTVAETICGLGYTMVPAEIDPNLPDYMLSPFIKLSYKRSRIFYKNDTRTCTEVWVQYAKKKGETDYKILHVKISKFAVGSVILDQNLAPGKVRDSARINIGYCALSIDLLCDDVLGLIAKQIGIVEEYKLRYCGADAVGVSYYVDRQRLFDNDAYPRLKFRLGPYMVPETIKVGSTKGDLTNIPIDGIRQTTSSIQ